jgi:hypothetical protein
MLADEDQVQQTLKCPAQAVLTDEGQRADDKGHGERGQNEKGH